MKKISAKALRKKLETEKVHILDVRNEEKFAKDHLKHKHAANLNVFKEDIFALETGKNKGLPFSKDEPVVVTCTTGNSATRCANILKEKGYDVTVLDGGMTAWNDDK